VTGSEEDTTIGFVLADDVAGSRSRENTIPSDDKVSHTISSTDLEDGLNSWLGEVTTITTNDNRRTLWRY